MQRDVGGYAVALASSMKRIFCGEAGETMFTTSDIGWVVGHSYIVYAPLIAGIDHDHVRGRADPTRRGRVVEDRAGPQGRGDVLGADRDPRAEKARSGLPREVRPLLAQAPLPRRRAARRADARLDQRGARPPGDRPLLANRDRLAAAVRGPGRREDARSRWARRAFPVYGYDVRLLHEATGKEVERRRERRSDDHAAAAAGLHVDGLGRRRALRATPISRTSGTSWSTRPSTGASATRTATTSSSAAPTT